MSTKVAVTLVIDSDKVNKLRTIMGDDRTTWFLSTALDAAMASFEARRTIDKQRAISAYCVGSHENGRVRVFRLVRDDSLVISWGDIAVLYGSSNPSIDGRGYVETHDTVDEHPDTGTLRYKKMTLASVEQTRASLLHRKQTKIGIQKAYQVVDEIERDFENLRNEQLRMRCMTTL